jgi:O-acetylserine/cysteine efflux transporter
MMIIGEHISTPNLISTAIIIMGLAVGLYRKSPGTIHAAPRAGLRSD